MICIYICDNNDLFCHWQTVSANNLIMFIILILVCVTLLFYFTSNPRSIMHIFDVHIDEMTRWNDDGDIEVERSMKMYAIMGILGVNFTIFYNVTSFMLFMFVLCCSQWSDIFYYFLPELTSKMIQQLQSLLVFKSQQFCLHWRKKNAKNKAMQVRTIAHSYWLA